jgi:hypothetical protein
VYEYPAGEGDASLVTDQAHASHVAGAICEIADAGRDDYSVRQSEQIPVPDAIFLID